MYLLTLPLLYVFYKNDSDQRLGCMLIEAEDAEREGDHESDLTVSEDMLTLDPGFHYARIRKARALLRLGLPSEALVEYQKVPISGDNLQPYLIAQLQRSDVLNHVHRKSDALNVLNALLLLPLSSEDQSRVHFRIGNILFDLEKLHGSLESFNRAQELAPNLHREEYFHTYRGKVLKKLGLLKEAVAEFDHDIRNFPSNYSVLHHKISILAELGAYNDALSAVDQFLQHSHSHAEARFVKGTILIELDKLPEAISEWEQSHHLAPSEHLSRVIEKARRMQQMSSK